MILREAVLLQTVTWTIKAGKIPDAREGSSGCESKHDLPPAAGRRPLEQDQRLRLVRSSCPGEEDRRMSYPPGLAAQRLGALTRDAPS